MSYELRLLFCSLAVGATVAVGASVISRLRRARRARLARAALGDAALVALCAPREGFAVLEGELACDAPIERIEDGAAAAVSSVAVRPSRHPKRYFATSWAGTRAEQLRLRWRGHEIAIDGPVRVVLGSSCKQLGYPLRSSDPALRERAGRAGATAFEDAEVTCHSLAAGDRVVVSGELARASSDDEVGYRESAHAWRLAPRCTPARSHIDMVHAGGASTSRAVLVALAVAVVLAAALGQVVGAAPPSGPLPLLARTEAMPLEKPFSASSARRAPFAAQVTCKRCFSRGAAGTPQLCCGDRGLADLHERGGLSRSR